MSKRKEVERLVEQLERGGIPRREFVVRALALGLSMSSVGMLLQACQRKDGAAGKAADSAGTAVADLGPIEKELHVYNWSDYIADNTVPNFEKEFGVKVTYDTYESNEEMVAKLQAGATGYDIVVPSGYIVPVMVATDLITPINKKYLTNFNNVSPIFQNLPTDPGNKYTVPWQWGTSGIAYRLDKVKAPVDSWAVFQDKQYAQEDDHDGRRPGGDRRVAPLPGPLPQLHQPGGAGQGQGRLHRGQEESEGLHLGAGQGPAHFRRRLDLAALERGHHPGQGRAAQAGLRHSEGRLHHLGRLDVHPQERSQQAGGARVDELHPAPRGGRGAVRGHRLRHPERGGGKGDEGPASVSDRGRAQAARVSGGPGQRHGHVGPDLDRDQVGIGRPLRPL